MKLQTQDLWELLSLHTPDIIRALIELRGEEYVKDIFKNDYEEYQLNVTEDNEVKPSKALKDDESDNCFKVAQAECPDVEYFDTLDDAKRYCDRHLIDYGHIMLCDSEKKEIGDWGDYE